MDERFFLLDYGAVCTLPHFGSTRLRVAEYRGQEYFCTIRNDYRFDVYSETALDRSSSAPSEGSGFRYYRTVLSIDELSDVYDFLIYGKYRENMYPVVDVSPDSDDAVLNARFGHFDADRQLGFRYNTYYEGFVLQVKKSNIEFYYLKESCFSRVERQIGDYHRKKK